jgi:hypothetical protein
VESKAKTIRRPDSCSIGSRWSVSKAPLLEGTRHRLARAEAHIVTRLCLFGDDPSRESSGRSHLVAETIHHATKAID